MVKILRVSLFLVILAFIMSNVAQIKEVDAACYCVNPVDDGCACTGTPPTGVPLFDAEFNGIPLKCTDERDPNSVFSIKDAVCDGRWNNEIPPYCAFVSDSEVTCWGIGFVNDPGTAFSTDGRWIEWPDLDIIINFNGFTSDRNGNGINDEVTSYVGCHANVYCCGRGEREPDENGQGGGPTCRADPQDQITGGCGPSKGVQNDQDIVAACHGYDGDQGDHSGQGESRLWFSQVRLVSTLAAIAQTMFNPFKLDGRYQDTALSKNSPVSDPSGRIDNQGTLTTRVERYQGVHDDTIVVNQTDNNSSVVVKNPAPPHLFSFENDPERENFPYDDSRACYMPDALENPGDDLVGPRIKGELLFTEEFVYTPLPNTDCVADGASYIPAAGDRTNRCCSQKTSTGNACRRLVSGETCDPDTETNQVCSGVQSCCPVGSACGDSAVLCVAPDPIELPTEGYTEVFSKTPMIELIYNTIVDGTDSLFKRFFPLSSWTTNGVTVPFEEIPAKTGFKASVTGNVSSVSYAEGQSSSPEVYFPHLGSLDKYWLYDFQKGLRPKGFERGPSDGSGGDGPPGICKLGFGPCSVDSLTPYYQARGGSCGVNEATIASQLCQRESNSGPMARNISCLTQPTGGFSIGLFQVNLAPVPQYDPVTNQFTGVGDIRRCLEFGPAGSTFLLDARTPEEAKYCRIANPGSADCSDLIPGLTECNVPLRRCIEKYFNAEENIKWATQMCSGSGSSCQCNWNPWAFDPDQYPNACNPIP